MKHEVITITAGGVATRVWAYGSADPLAKQIILLHGFRGDHHGLQRIAAELLRRYSQPESPVRLVVPDLPGFADSSELARHDLRNYAKWLTDFAQQIAPQGSYLVAHSFGTLVAAAAIAAGYNPISVVLINPISAPALGGSKTVLTALTRLYYLAGYKLPAAVADPLLKNSTIVRLMSAIMTKTSDKRERKWIHNQHAQYFSGYRSRRALLEAFNASVSHTVLDFAPHLKQPTAVIAGSLDEISPLADQLKLSKELSCGSFYLIGGVGHLIHYEAASEAAEIIKKHFDSSH